MQLSSGKYRRVENALKQENTAEENNFNISGKKNDEEKSVFQDVRENLEPPIINFL